MAEILLGGILPIVLLSIKKIRQTREGLLTSAILAILGIMSQRMSLSMFTMFREEGTTYSPSLGETVIAFAIPAAAVLLYLFFAENLQLFEKQAEGPEGEALAPVPVSSGALRRSNQLGASRGCPSQWICHLRDRAGIAGVVPPEQYASQPGDGCNWLGNAAHRREQVRVHGELPPPGTPGTAGR